MDYIGSKVKFVNWIFEHVPKESSIFLDACSGSGAVSRKAASLGYRVIANDIMKFPSVIANGSIGLSDEQKKEAINLMSYLNQLEGVSGYFYLNFCEESPKPRKYFTAQNARVIDHVRQEIEKVSDEKVKDYLLYCALEAISRVSNTTGVQAAYLKEFKGRAQQNIQLREEETVPGMVKSYCSDILKLLQENDFQETILYIDPPYNGRQYGPNYHLYETFVRNDNPTPSEGITGLRDWKNESASEFCTKRCLDFLCRVVTASKAKLVLISYSSDGLLTKEDFFREFPCSIAEIEQKRYKADSLRKFNQEPLFEYLVIIPRWE